MGAEKPTKALFILREFGNQYIFGDFKKHLKNKSFHLLPMILENVSD